VTSVTINDAVSFEDAFGTLGLKVNPRTGANKRAQDDEEWFIIRRFLRAAVDNGKFEVPFNVRKQDPPAPDFAIEQKNSIVLIEITEAGARSDHREMTISEGDEEPTLLGEHGGRFKGGIVGDQAERTWSSDVLRAIRRKRSKQILARHEPCRHLVIYPNFPAIVSMDEQEALGILQEAAARNSASLSRALNGCEVHILGSGGIMFNILAASTPHPPTLA
jgi:hypothetical protein